MNENEILLVGRNDFQMLKVFNKPYQKDNAIVFYDFTRENTSATFFNELRKIFKNGGPL